MINFHTFNVINTNTGAVIMTFQQIGVTVEQSRALILNYNLKDLDWTDRKLVYVEPKGGPGVKTESCGCRFNWSDKFYESRCLFHQMESELQQEFEAEHEYYERAA